MERALNETNILALADMIEAAARPESNFGLGFNMSDFVSGFNEDMTLHNCGTTACIAGWAVACEADGRVGKPDAAKLRRADSMSSLEREAMDFLGITEEQANELFFECPTGVMFDETTPTMAVNTLRRLAKTGEVGWDAANPDCAEAEQ